MYLLTTFFARLLSVNDAAIQVRVHNESRRIKLDADASVENRDTVLAGWSEINKSLPTVK